LIAVTTQLGHGRPLFLVLYIGLIVFFAFFYTAVVFNPTETADNLKKHGGFIPGIRPGERTAEHIDYVLTRITCVGAIYLSIVCLIPEMLISYAAVPFYFGGTSLLIVVSVTMDTVAQIQGYLLAHQYEGLIKRSKLRGRGDEDCACSVRRGPARGRRPRTRFETTASCNSPPATCCGRPWRPARRSASRPRTSWPRRAGAGRRGGRNRAPTGSASPTPSGLHPRRLPAHRAAGRGARPHARREGLRLDGVVRLEVDSGHPGAPDRDRGSSEMKARGEPLGPTTIPRC
jgi:hypothetical protein